MAYHRLVGKEIISDKGASRNDYIPYGSKRTFVELILISEVFLKTCLMALTSAKSPASVEVACALI
jgi:hypothetical protein